MTPSAIAFDEEGHGLLWCGSAGSTISIYLERKRERESVCVFVCERETEREGERRVERESKRGREGEGARGREFMMKTEVAL